MLFKDFNFHSQLQEGLDSMNFREATPIQQQAIPVISEGKDLIACAQTGTGKTAAFLLPVMNKIISSEKRFLNTLILAPTRELAVQIDQQVEGLGYFCGVGSIAIYGGGDAVAWGRQKRALQEGVDIVIATPGRLIALLQAGDIDFSHLQHFILDEADRMLDMGFYDDILRILKYLPEKRQNICFSATMPVKMRELAKRILFEPAEINIAIAKPAEGLDQRIYIVYENQKAPLLNLLLQEKDYQSVLIFSSTKEKVKQLERDLKKWNIHARAFHSDLEQQEREELMIKFKSRNLKILVGTDVLSRGIDVEGIDLVVNYDVPPDAEDYVHRIGRTARAQSTGTAITFVNENDFRKFDRIERLIQREIPRFVLPEQIGPAPEYKVETIKKKKKSFTKGNFKRRFSEKR
ncbi:MAG: DEAD/DEAH box helicase [Bacteroidota bacterium]